MSWAKLDDGFWDHPKVIAAGNEAAGMFARALSYTARQELDGRVPAGALALIGGPRTKALVSRLVAVGLFEPCDEGVVIHDYLKFNPSKEQQAARRKATSERVSRYRNGVGNEGCNAVTPAYQSEDCNTSPGPTRPVPVVEPPVSPPAGGQPKKASRAERLTAWPAGFVPDPKWLPPGFDYQAQVDAFRDHHEARGNRFASWPAAWRTWCRRAPQWAPRPAAKPVVDLPLARAPRPAVSA